MVYRIRAHTYFNLKRDRQIFDYIDFYWRCLDCICTVYVYSLKIMFQNFTFWCYPGRGLSRIFCLGGKSILKKIFEPRGGEKKFFRPSRGSGSMLPRKILKI